ncbi:MAG: hypothetical protein ABI384_00175, partial [Allobranchiibius sp.]
AASDKPSPPPSVRLTVLRSVTRTPYVPGRFQAAQVPGTSGDAVSLTGVRPDGDALDPERLLLSGFDATPLPQGCHAVPATDDRERQRAQDAALHIEVRIGVAG